MHLLPRCTDVVQWPAGMALAEHWGVNSAALRQTFVGSMTDPSVGERPLQEGSILGHGHFADGAAPCWMRLSFSLIKKTSQLLQAGAPSHPIRLKGAWENTNTNLKDLDCQKVEMGRKIRKLGNEAVKEGYIRRL